MQNKKTIVQGICNLSPLQEEILLQCLSDKKGRTYTTQMVLCLEGKLDISLFERSINVLIEKYEILRANFAYGIVETPRQVVLSERLLKVYFEDISRTENINKNSYIRKYIEEDANKEFDLRTDILMRASVIQLSRDVLFIILNFHNIVIDSWSIGVVSKELFSTYLALQNSIESQKKQVDSFFNYIKGIKKDNEEAALHWKEYLENYKPDALKLFNYKKSAGAFEDRQTIIDFKLDKELTARLIEVAKQERVGIDTVFLAIWGISLQTIFMCEDVVVGTVVPRRPVKSADINRTLGLLANIIPIRIKGGKGISFFEILRSIQETFLKAEKYSSLSSPCLQKHYINHSVDFNFCPIDEEIKNFINSNNMGFIAGNVVVNVQTDYDLNVVVTMGDELLIKINYNPHATNKNFIAGIEGHLKKAASMVSEKFVNTRVGEREAMRSEKRYYNEIKPIDKKIFYPVSSAQKRIYIASQIESNTLSYNIPQVLTIEGKLNYLRLEKTFIKLIQRHEPLRTSFHIVDGEIVQKIYENVDFHILFSEIQEMDINSEVRKLIRPFDLSKVPLLRVAVIKLTEEKHLIFLDIHHIISDGVSVTILSNDFINLYENKELTELKVQYKDYAILQNAQRNSDNYKKQREYWLKKIDDYQYTEIPKKNKIGVAAEGKKNGIKFDTSLFNNIDSFCKRNGITKFTFIFSVFALVIQKEVNQNTVSIGIPINVRNNIEFWKIIGTFQNILIINAKINYYEKYMDYLLAIKETIIDAFNYMEYPYEDLYVVYKERLIAQQDSLFTIFLNYTPHIENNNLVDNELTIKPFDIGIEFPKFDITLYLIEQEDVLELKLVYKSSLIEEYKILRILDNIEEITKQVLKNSDILICEIDLKGYNADKCFDLSLESYFDNADFL